MASNAEYDLTGAQRVADVDLGEYDMAGSQYVFSLEDAEAAGVAENLPLSFDEPIQAEHAQFIKDMVNQLGVAEGTKAHVGIDADNLTLPYGIVADSVEYDGKWVTPRGWSGTLDADKLNMETATKWGIARSDYESDEEWVASLVQNRVEAVEKEVPNLADDTARHAMVSSVWNSGMGGLKWSGYKETITQLQEAPEDRDPAATIGWAKHSYAGGKPVFGLFKRRIEDANLALTEGDRIDEIRQEKAVRENGQWTTKFVAMRNGQDVREFVLKGRPSTNRDRTIKLGD